MKIYAFTDNHGDTKSLTHIKKQVKKLKPDLVICTGDLTIFEHEMRPLLSRINMLKVPVLMLHGNHESEERLRTMCDDFPRITFLHKEFLQKGGYTFVAFGGGGFEDYYPELEKLAKSKAWRNLDWEKTVFLSHAPPFDTRLDDVGELGEEWHVGSKTLRKLIKKRQPLLLLAGHIHDCFEESDMIGQTLMENPGPDGKLYDLQALERARKK